MNDEIMGKATDILANALDGFYSCGRVWEGWSYGTMTQYDFTPAAEEEEWLEETVKDIISSRDDEVLALTSRVAVAEGANEELKAENKKLREALEEIAEYGHCETHEDGENMMDIAFLALKDGE